MRATIHDDWTVRVTPPHPATGMLNLVFRDLTEEGVPMGFQEVYPIAKEQALALIEELKKKSMDIKVAGANEMPEPPNLHGV